MSDYPILTPEIVLAGELYDGVSPEPQAGRALILRDGRIERIVPESQLSAADLTGGDVLDCREQSVIPGLIDTHVHLTFSAGPTHQEVRDVLASEDDAALALRAIRNAQAHLADGVTTLRDCGGRGFVTLAVRDAIRDGVVVGPRVLACGPAITTSRGHLHYLGAVAEGEDQVRQWATDVVNRGADFVKICATGGIMTEGSDPLLVQYTVPELKAAVGVAEQSGKRVAAHCLAAEGLRRCVEAGVRTIEHCLWQEELGEYSFDPKVAEKMKAQEIYAGLTYAGLGQARYWERKFGRKSPADLGVWQERMENRYVAERQMIAAGVPYTVHTDAGVRETPFGVFWAAMGAMAWELQLPPVDVIQAATATAARALGLDDQIGTLEPGKQADMVIVSGSPLGRLEALSGRKTVLLGGRVVARDGSVLVPPISPLGV